MHTALLRSRTVVVALVLACVCALSAPAQAADAAPCATPRKAAATILGNLNKRPPDVERALRCIDVPKRLPRAALLERLATLQATLDAKGVVVRPKDIPDDADHLDDKSFLPVFVLTPAVPRLRLERDDRGDWRLPADVIDGADAIYADVAVVDVEDFALRFGARGQERVLGLRVWQWVGLFLVLGLGVLLRFVVAALVVKRASALLVAVGLENKPDELRAASRPLGFVIGFVVVLLTVPNLALPAALTAVIVNASRVSVALGVVWLAFGVIDVAAFHFAARAKGSVSRMDDHLVPLLRRIAKIAVVVIGVVAGLQFVGIDVGSLVAGLGIGGLAVALAAKDTIGNFFGSIAIFLDRPFQIGDWVTTGTGHVEGTVESIGFRSTQIRTIRDTVVTVPNAKLADAEIDNWGARKHRRVRVVVPFALDTDPTQIDAFVTLLRAALAARTEVRKEGFDIHLHEFAEGTMQVLVHIYVAMPDWSQELAFRHQVLAEILRTAEDLGLKLASPTRTQVSATPAAPTGPLSSSPSSAAAAAPTGKP